MTQTRFFLLMILVLLVGCVSAPQTRKSVKTRPVKEHAFITVTAGGNESHYSKKDIFVHGGIPVPKYGNCTILQQQFLNLHPRDMVLNVACKIPAFGFENRDLRYDYNSQTSILRLWIEVDGIYTISPNPLDIEFIVTFLQYNRFLDLSNEQDVYFTFVCTWETAYSPMFDTPKYNFVGKDGYYSLNKYDLKRKDFKKLYTQVKRMQTVGNGPSKLKELSDKISSHFLSLVKDENLINYLKTFKLFVGSERK